MTLPAGIERREVDGESALATRGPPVGTEAVAEEWRRWDPRRSKLAAMLELGLDTGPLDGPVLYLGAAAGTTVSHVADVGGPTYAVEFAPRPMRDLVDVAADRDNLFPLLKDARAPERYAHVVEPVTVLVQDVATRGQADVALANRQFLDPDGRLLLSVKARSEDVTRDPNAVFDEVLDRLETGFDVESTVDLAPFHDDHLAVLAVPA
ncbi:MAG: fibrillarin-like rRNA/tRNA 2'-O-methyltransferase [Haloarculaceae archaeon]